MSFYIEIKPPSDVAFELGAEHRLSIAYNLALGSGITSPIAGVSIGECQIVCMHSDAFVRLGIQEGFGISIRDSWDDGYIFTGLITSIKNRVSSDSNSVVLSCADLLHGLLGEGVPTIQIERGITLGAFLKVILGQFGVSFQIDSALASNVLDYGFLAGAKVGEFFNMLTTAYLCYIFVDGAGVLQFASRGSTGSSYKSIDGSNYVIRTAIGAPLYTSYSVVKVGYTHTSVGGSEQVLEIKDIIIKPGLNNLTGYNIPDKDLYCINYIKCSCIEDVVCCVGYTCGQNSVDLIIENTGTVDIVCTLQVWGFCLKSVESFLFEENAIAIAKIGRKELEVSNKLLTNEAKAKGVASALALELSAPVPYIECEVIHANEFNVGQNILIHSGKLNVDYRGYVYSISANIGNNSLCKCRLTIKVVS